MAKAPKLEIAIAEMAVLLRTTSERVEKIDNRLSVFEENFARREEVDKNAAAIIDLRNGLQTQEINLAVAKSQLRTWGVVGGIVVTLISAIISALQIRL